MPKKAKSIQLIFDDDRKKFYRARDQLSGVVLLQSLGNVAVVNIKVHVFGKADTEVTEVCQDTDGKRQNLVHKAEKVYLDYFQLVCGTDDTRGLSIIPEGEHRFPFSCNLPTDLPSSLQRHKEKKVTPNAIRYYVHCVVNYSEKKSDNVYKPFQVQHLLNVDDPVFSVPPSPLIEERTVTSLACIPGDIKLTASIARQAFLNFEPILINAEIGNFSRRRLTALEVALIRNEEYNAEGVSNTKSYEIAKISTGRIAARQTIHWSSEPLPLPDYLTPTLLNCPLIKVNYQLEFTLKIPGAENITRKLDIIIGTVTNEIISQLQINPPQSQAGSRHNSTLSANPDTPPPPYSVLEPNNLDDQTPSAPEVDSMAAVAIN
ncbi:uncharacterized protein TRIADDRAFT_57433 [Trichoplax adhaerens]|uniref:Arrestin C-terminal-like domain-containing protein n=1 Tax=Trichoplax adhaerens TaxID=10228 RepID=B3RZF3_TRIAD|nr:hypothetical protein TRIADDRAFT_57433 [Trichoplax adhaerens]EDV24192.1 hypothetical protein TRIADDRAFT_57433 [Trichoplax adhaerens]|eukprot:XP_002113718.1 hypothetical protein TRIADDRAFT_57433 [Trichoplax adhaerens]